MDAKQFDVLTRIFGTRRSVLSAGMAGLLGLIKVDVAAAHNPAPACKRIKDPKRRRACLRRARAHNRRHRQTCVPQPELVTCAGRCGAVLNNCNKVVTCFICPPGRTCLSNGSCAEACAGNIGPEECPSGCFCTDPGNPSVEGGRHCLTADLRCADIPHVCSSTAECPVGQQCVLTSCGGANPHRCVPLCPT